MRLNTYEMALANSSLHMWTDGDALHKIKSCACDKCGELRSVRVAKREAYRKEYRKTNSEKIVAYQSALRDFAASKGRPRCISVSWQGCSWLDKDYELWLAVRNYCESKSLSPAELVKKLLQKEIKKGVQS